MKSPVPQAHVLAFHVEVTWAALFALVIEVAAVSWYVAATRRSGARGRPWSRPKTACFVAAVLVAAYALEGGIAHYGRSNFTVNAVRCLLLVDVVPPLLAWSTPMTLALRSSSQRLTSALLDLLSGPRARAAAHPVLALVAVQGIAYVYFLTPLYGAAARHGAVEAVVELAFVVAGALYWWPVVGRDVSPRPLGWVGRFALVFASVPLNIALGVALSSLARAPLPAYNTLADTHTGGDVYWEMAEVLTVVVLAVLFVSFAYEEERKAQGTERAGDGPRPAVPPSGADAG